MNILIVDDEIYSVEGISNHLDWPSLGIKNVFQAYSMKQAQDVIVHNKIDILVCDIEMPRGSGIDLLTWARQESYPLECIFLTSYSKFEYASQAIKLQIFDYILKPAEYKLLYTVLQRLIEKIQKDRETESKRLFEEYWSEEEVHIVSELWNGILDQSISSSKGKIEHYLKIRHIDTDKVNQSYFIVLVKPVPTDDMLLWDNEMFQAAFTNITLESLDTETILYKNLYITSVILKASGYNGNPKELGKHLTAYLSNLESVFSVRFQAYFNIAYEMHEAYSIYSELVDDSKSILTTNNYIYYHNDRYQEKNLDAIASKRDVWQNALLAGDYDSVYQDIVKLLELPHPQEIISVQALQRVYHEVMKTVYTCFEITVTDSRDHFREKSTLSEDCYYSIPQFLDSIHAFLLTASEVLKSHNSADTSTYQIKKYILNNLDSDLSRNEIAKVVHLNQDYLSTLFKDKTGLSITEYINQERLKYAKQLLFTTNLPIHEVAIKSGFQNISYFSKIFKKQEHKTPLKFRQDILKP